jgi:hypothetical protein
MAALRCTCKEGVPYCAAHPQVPSVRTTEELVRQIVDESRAAGLESKVVSIGDTSVVVVQNPARIVPRGPDLVPIFYVAKIHCGRLITERFV